MKINIQVEMPDAGKETKAALPSLDERVEYAICQIDCNTPEKKDAISFLRQLVHVIDGLKRPTELQQHCKKLAEAAVADYGTYYAGMKEDN